MQNIKSLVLIAFLLCIGCKSKGEIPADPPAPHPPADTLTVEDCSRCMVLSEQSKPAVRIVDVDKGKELWQWDPYRRDDVTEPDWFSNPDEAKPVYDNDYLLITASGGGIVLVRIADKKVLFQAMAGGNPHSAELLPDGNIVTASSTGDYLRIFHVDTLQTPGEGYSKKIPIPFGHNVVWDKKCNLLWSAGEDKLYGYEYNFNCTAPDLSPIDSLQLRGSGAHDLFPAYGKDKLWLTMNNAVYLYDLSKEKAELVDTPYQKHIKSVSSGPDDYPAIIIQPKEQWWTDEVIDLQGKSLFKQGGYKIYKARWLVHNHFSYSDERTIEVCEEEGSSIQDGEEIERNSH